MSPLSYRRRGFAGAASALAPMMGTMSAPAPKHFSQSLREFMGSPFLSASGPGRSACRKFCNRQIERVSCINSFSDRTIVAPEDASGGNSATERNDWDVDAQAVLDHRVKPAGIGTALCRQRANTFHFSGGHRREALADFGKTALAAEGYGMRILSHRWPKSLDHTSGAAAGPGWGGHGSTPRGRGWSARLVSHGTEDRLAPLSPMCHMADIRGFQSSRIARNAAPTRPGAHRALSVPGWPIPPSIDYLPCPHYTVSAC